MVFNPVDVGKSMNRAPPAGFVPPTPLAPPCASVSLWFCALRPASIDPSLVAWLSEQERARMRRFGNDALRARYLIGRASLRWVLAQTIGVAPDAVMIERGARGRPQLAGARILDFNVSHTADAALIGVAHEGRIGVDIERADRAIHSSRLAQRILTDAERAALPDGYDDVRRRILRLWTCKEALAKATGDAMSAPFSRLDIVAAPTLALAAGPPPYDPAAFSLFAAAVPDAYLATVALWRPYNAAPK